MRDPQALAADIADYVAARYDAYLGDFRPSRRFRATCLEVGTDRAGSGSARFQALGGASFVADYHGGFRPKVGEEWLVSDTGGGFLVSDRAR